MKREIASLKERMAQGGDWKVFRDEIAALHKEAKTEEEYVTLLEAWRDLVAVGKFAYDEETWAKLFPITQAEYRMFLNKESMEDGIINPVRLERITRREVEAGRLDPDDEFVKLAAAASSVLGDSGELTAHRCRSGDWFCYGMGSAALAAYGLSQLNQSVFWLVAIGLIVGWFLNERERKQIKLQRKNALS